MENQSKGQNQSMGKNQNQAANSGVPSYTNSMTAGVRPVSSQSGNIQASTGQMSYSNNQGSKAVIGIFNSRQDAEKAVSQLRNNGFNTEEINIVSKNDKQNKDESKTYDDDISDGALTGGTLGGIGGLLLGAGVVASVGAMAIPGIGPIIASGPIAAAIGGAVAGGVAGGLIDWGIPAEASQRYEKSVAKGGILAVIRTNAGKVDTAAQILRQYGATDIESHTAKQ
ncbi:MAG: general stress protein [Negativicutes bacterium]|nr:general stress protein [Negativicutes bacterium]